MDNHIQEIREASEPYISQRKLAEKVGTSRTTIQSLEKGKTGAVNQFLPAIAKVLECTIDDLVYGREEASLLHEQFGSYGSEDTNSLVMDLQSQLEEQRKINQDLQAEYDELLAAYKSLEQVSAYQKKQLDKAD